MSTLDTHDIIELLKRMPEADRAAHLELLYTNLDTAAAQLGLPRRYPLAPESVPADDRRPRPEVWEPLLARIDQYAAMPPVVRARILATTVDVETSFIDDRLDSHWRETGAQTALWNWDPATATARLTGGSLEPAPAPDIATCLSEAAQQTRRGLAGIIGFAVRGWTLDQLEFLRRQDWAIDYREDHLNEVAPPHWRLDAAHHRLILLAHLRPHQLWRPLTSTEADRFAQLAADLTATPDAEPGPVAAAFPAALTASNLAVVNAQLDDSLLAGGATAEVAGALDAPQEGPVR
jgi:hypothetical protein